MNAVVTVPSPNVYTHNTAYVGQDATVTEFLNFRRYHDTHFLSISQDEQSANVRNFGLQTGGVTTNVAISPELLEASSVFISPTQTNWTQGGGAALTFNLT